MVSEKVTGVTGSGGFVQSPYRNFNIGGFLQTRHNPPHPPLPSGKPDQTNRHLWLPYAMPGSWTGQ